MEQKSIWRNIDQKLSKFDKDIRLSIQYLSKSKHDQYKENYIEAHHIQTAKAKDKDLESNQKKAHPKTIKMTAEEREKKTEHYQSWVLYP